MTVVYAVQDQKIFEFEANVASVGSPVESDVNGWAAAAQDAAWLLDVQEFLDEAQHADREIALGEDNQG